MWQPVTSRSQVKETRRIAKEAELKDRTERSIQQQIQQHEWRPYQRKSSNKNSVAIFNINYHGNWVNCLNSVIQWMNKLRISLIFAGNWRVSSLFRATSSLNYYNNYSKPVIGGRAFPQLWKYSRIKFTLMDSFKRMLTERISMNWKDAWRAST